MTKQEYIDSIEGKYGKVFVRKIDTKVPDITWHKVSYFNDTNANEEAVNFFVKNEGKENEEVVTKPEPEKPTQEEVEVAKVARFEQAVEAKLFELKVDAEAEKRLSE